MSETRPTTADTDYRDGLYRIPDLFQWPHYRQIEPAAIQPLAPYLDHEGEIYRQRLVTLSPRDNTEQMCLRPDYTIALAQHLISQNHLSDLKKSRRFSYFGPVYQHNNSDNSQDSQIRVQIGVEHVGIAGTIDDDLAVIDVADKLWRQYGRDDSDNRICAGDVSVVRALIDALGFRDEVKTRVWRKMAHHNHPEQVIKALAPRPLPPALGSIVAKLDKQHGQYRKEDFFAATRQHISANNVNLGGRTETDLLNHSWNRVQAEQIHLSGQQETALRALLGLRCDVNSATSRIREITKDIGINIDEQLSELEPRLIAISKIAPSLTSVFEGHPHRAHTYYTGFTMRIGNIDSGRGNTVLRGGRYDSLFARLGCNEATAAAGCALTMASSREAATGKTKNTTTN